MRFEGISMYPGVARGAARRLVGDGRMLRTVSESFDRDIARLEKIFQTYREQFELFEAELAAGSEGTSFGSIEENKFRMITGATLCSTVRQLVERDGGGVPRAMATILADHFRIIELVDTEELRRSATDIARIIEHILTSFVCQQRLQGEGILVAADLRLADIPALIEKPVAGLVLETANGGAETDAVARILRIPALKGVPGLIETVQENEPIEVDADQGVLTLERVDA